MTKTRRTIRDRDIVDPSKIVGKLYSDYIEGVLDDKAVLYRAQVVGIDLVGGQLETNPAPNPPGSVKARILSLDRYKTDDDLTVFWPMFPYDLMPIKENEHVYVIFEDPEGEHGLWLSRIPEPNDVNKLNKTLGSAKYTENASNNLAQSVSTQQHVLDMDDEVAVVSGSGHFITEDVPRYTGRVGDRIIHGSNNAMISLGRDRVTDTASGLTEQAGTIDLVTGRQGIDNNLGADLSRIYISSKTNADANFSIPSSAGEAVSETATVVIKSNQIRIIARQGTKIVNEEGDIVIHTPGDITIEGENINIGLNAEQSAVLGEKLQDFITQLVTMIKTGASAIPTSMGPTSFTNATTFDVGLPPLKPYFDAIVSAHVKVKA
jgi:hypothetical protein